MTIDEAIVHAREVAEYNRKCNENSDCIDITCERCAEEHEQLAEWLEELKMYRESSYGELYSMVYNKAIDDAKSVILQTIDNEILVDTLHFRLEQLKEHRC